jgi:hypothetical protein
MRISSWVQQTSCRPCAANYYNYALSIDTCVYFTFTKSCIYPIIRDVTAVGDDTYAARFRNLMLQVMHSWLLYSWLLDSLTQWIILFSVCLCGGTHLIVALLYVTVSVPYNCFSLDVIVLSSVVYSPGCGLMFWRDKAWQNVNWKSECWTCSKCSSISTTWQ